jgi:hypothetical protein
MACDGCEIWQHIFCHEEEIRRRELPPRDWDNCEFVCSRCQGQGPERKVPPIEGSKTARAEAALRLHPPVAKPYHPSSQLSPMAAGYAPIYQRPLPPPASAVNGANGQQQYAPATRPHQLASYAGQQYRGPAAYPPMSSTPGHPIQPAQQYLQMNNTHPSASAGYHPPQVASGTPPLGYHPVAGAVSSPVGYSQQPPSSIQGSSQPMSPYTQPSYSRPTYAASRPGGAMPTPIYDPQRTRSPYAPTTLASQSSPPMSTQSRLSPSSPALQPDGRQAAAAYYAGVHHMASSSPQTYASVPATTPSPGPISARRVSPLPQPVNVVTSMPAPSMPVTMGYPSQQPLPYAGQPAESYYDRRPAYPPPSASPYDSPTVHSRPPPQPHQQLSPEQAQAMFGHQLPPSNAEYQQQQQQRSYLAHAAMNGQSPPI